MACRLVGVKPLYVIQCWFIANRKLRNNVLHRQIWRLNSGEKPVKYFSTFTRTCRLTDIYEAYAADIESQLTGQSSVSLAFCVLAINTETFKVRMQKALSFHEVIIDNHGQW